MATQRILLVAIGGRLAESVWTKICGWADARTTALSDEFSPSDWPASILHEVDRFAKTISDSAFTPPILYRSEHVDCWSMGDVYSEALVKQDLDYCRQLASSEGEIIATWVRFSEQIIADKDAPVETVWFYNRVNEAIAAWGELAEQRLIVCVRSVLGGLWTDDEVIASLTSNCAWWDMQDRANSCRAPASDEMPED